jgi:hypothetical protein
MTYHQISGDQHPDFPGPKFPHHGITLHLRPIGVNDVHVDAVVHQFAVQRLGSFDRLDKHDDRGFQSFLPGEDLHWSQCRHRNNNKKNQKRSISGTMENKSIGQKAPNVHLHDLTHRQQFA